ncbi:Pimeloyl-ACP methyl ester carboxylesterase [Seinonella peptonophila]|uniref:Pimeloyl-ACP methyl ester carboxylesterase n=1 Tax=Seinonella peptonophila TaxID=112248 RepID=A0A1M4SMF0_9BACL|nr:alpha/beta hydrolase [Seinonella peptonophila]SHE33157.1 Pimeloyl-ACP methyl ester carboxylesterase [Seinonella peptonophila]
MAKVHQSKQSVGLVCIHGAGLHSRIWSGLSEQLNLPVLAIDFPTIPKKQLTLEEYTVYIQQQIQAWEIDKFVIIAHSIGGLLGLKIANMFQDRLVGFVAVGAAVPKKGGSFLSIFPFAKRVFMSLMLRIFGTKPPEAAIRQGLCNDLTNDQTADIINSFSPESIHLYIDNIEFSIPDVRKIYVKLMDDLEFSPLFQDQMIANLAPQSVEKLNTGHLPMLSNPQQLGLIINNFIESIE